MEQITNYIILFASLITACTTICVFCKKVINKCFEPLTKKIDNNTLNQDKRFLIQFMDTAERGEEISNEEMKVAFETKEEYNELGGDSYVDTKWDKLLEKEIIKII